MLESNTLYQILNLDFNLPKTKWDDAEGLTINNVYEIYNRKFVNNALKNANLSKPTVVFHINRRRQKYYLATETLVLSTSSDTCRVEKYM